MISLCLRIERVYPIVQRWKLRVREFKWLVWGHETVMKPSPHASTSLCTQRLLETHGRTMLGTSHKRVDSLLFSRSVIKIPKCSFNGEHIPSKCDVRIQLLRPMSHYQHHCVWPWSSLIILGWPQQQLFLNWNYPQSGWARWELTQMSSSFP